MRDTATLEDPLVMSLIDRRTQPYHDWAFALKR